MLQPRICRPSRTIEYSLGLLTTSLAAWTCTSTIPTATFIRHASHATQGRANGPKDSAGRRLGAKKTDSEYVVPGNIIFKQRGTKWFPGENVGIGKDHTIYATVAGYVRYYQDPLRHPKRRFIGVALERDGPGSVLPTPPNAATRRRLGMYVAPISHPPGADAALWLESHLSVNSKTATSTNQPSGIGGMGLSVPPPPVSARPKYAQNWESNWSIGRTAERKGITVREFDPKDRWLAWRKRSQKKKRKAKLRSVRASRKGKGNKKKGPLKVAPVVR
ncbi:hypothetical protein EPUS_03018 [Endocarpon pusillum Z07020]|uniref:Large ribosomal subunit protein bL27m n=1 Tax=Endocarpon pusillum (strain Z07020 / HMAS-L-300199) TaxID=1263415 RepID=U1G710_ENDPU|nr:uncharacterized protein EPUS_03018 [Endocarpon pusillum Z07020]ERF73177.1 hypothetical protein EPUS_03018 [Endocarpon pusillum Z07020]